MKKVVRFLLGLSVAAASTLSQAGSAHAVAAEPWPTGCQASRDLQYAFAWCTGGFGQVQVLTRCTAGAATKYGPWVAVGGTGPVRQSRVYCGTRPYWVSYSIRH